MKKIISGYLALIMFCLLLFGGVRAYLFSDTFQPSVYKSENSISYCARVQGKAFQLYNKDGSWTNSFLAGVNIGSGKPGYFPGELALTGDEYFTWFEQIAAMNTNVIRIYIPQSPAFYNALYKFNETSPTPLYVIQGIYVNENEVSKYYNVLADGSHLIDEFDKDIIDAINIIHGKAQIEAQRGKAYGSYMYDVSKYVIGWIFGIEWESQLVIGTNESSPERTVFNGQYCYTENASPFETFLAETAELAISYETEHYNMQRPVAFSNWPTTDPLEHPNEPNKEKEDIVSVDVEHIHATAAFEPGFFASYHVYPYYPDFMSYDPKYQVKGSNPYKEYLKELTAYHSMPVLISEFGLPTSRGKAHTNQVTGLNQGYLTETEQGNGLVSMMSDIHDTGCMGGIIFSWQDEWFKTTWNTTDYDNSAARPMWFNVMSAEENFGIVTYDTSENITVDGNRIEWINTDIVVDNGNEQLSVKQDEAYLYLLIKVGDFNNGTYIIPIATLQNSGNNGYEGTSFGRASDFLIILKGKDNSRILIDPYYNPNYKLYGSVLFGKEELTLFNTKNSGAFIDIQQVINRPLHLPNTEMTISKEMFTAGNLRFGLADSSSAIYDSLADFCENDNYVELRIPWQILNVADPSSGKVLSDLHENEKITFESVDAFYFGIGAPGVKEIPMNPYQLAGWKAPTYQERLKQSYSILQENFKQYRGVSGVTSKLNFTRGIRWFYLKFDEMLSLSELVSYLLCFSLSILLYLFAVLIIVNLRIIKRERVKSREKVKLLTLCNMPAPDISSHFNSKYLCSREGVDAIYEVLCDGAAWQIDKLKDILMKNNYGHYMRKLLRTINKQDICLIFKVAAMLGFKDFEYDILKFMSAGRKDLNIQYTAYIALSLLGCRDALIKLSNENNSYMLLSYRCLKEIFSVYSGDKRSLFGQLLYSPDGYIQRICIKVIGDEGYQEFEDALIPMLETNDVNLLCDVIRALGQLRSRKAAENLKAFAKHSEWPVRNVAVVSLGDIDLNKYVKDIAIGLFDCEWWVRYNSAKTLCNYEFIKDVYDAIEEAGDRFAKEMLTYVLAENNVSNRAKDNSTLSVQN